MTRGDRSDIDDTIGGPEQELITVIREFISSNMDNLIEDWVRSKGSLKSGAYESIPEEDLVEGSERFLRLLNDVLLEDDLEKVYQMLEGSLGPIIQKRVVQGVGMQNLLMGSVLHREIILRNLKGSHVYKGLKENLRVGLLLLVHRKFELVQHTLAKLTHEAAVSEIDRLKRFNENIISSVAEGIVIEDMNGIILYANPKFLEMLGYTSKDVVGQHWDRTVEKDHLKTFREEASKRNLGIPGKYDGVLVGKDGRRIPVLISARPLHEGGAFRGVLSVITDITDIKKMQNELARSKMELEHLNQELQKYTRTLEEDNIRLRAVLNIKPVHEAEMEGGRTYYLEPGYLYLITGKTPDLAFRIFEDLVKHGHVGLCISRMNPETVKKVYNLEKTPMVWLTSNSVPDVHCISPVNIVDLSSAIIKFLEKSKDGVIILEGLEYLISQNSYKSLLNLVQLLNDKVMLCDSRLLLTIDPDVLEDREVHNLKREVRLFEIERAKAPDEAGEE